MSFVEGKYEFIHFIQNFLLRIWILDDILVFITFLIMRFSFVCCFSCLFCRCLVPLMTCLLIIWSLNCCKRTISWFYNIQKCRSRGSNWYTCTYETLFFRPESQILNLIVFFREELGLSKNHTVKKFKRWKRDLSPRRCFCNVHMITHTHKHTNCENFLHQRWQKRPVDQWYPELTMEAL